MARGPAPPVPPAKPPPSSGLPKLTIADHLVDTVLAVSAIVAALLLIIGAFLGAHL